MLTCESEKGGREGGREAGIGMEMKWTGVVMKRDNESANKNGNEIGGWQEEGIEMVCGESSRVRGQKGREVRGQNRISPSCPGT